MARRLSTKLLRSTASCFATFNPLAKDSYPFLQQISCQSRTASTAASAPGLSSTAPEVSLLQLSSLPQIYKQLSKARLSALVVSTAAAGFVAGEGQAEQQASRLLHKLCSGDQICWDQLAWTALGTMGAASAANALNQLREVHQDSLMKRTCRRPLPLGRISRLHALAFAAVAGTAGVSLLAWKATSPCVQAKVRSAQSWQGFGEVTNITLDVYSHSVVCYMQTNWLAASLGAANIGMYAGVYTPLKMVSPINTWVGALVGAIPPLMGWAASSGQLDIGAGIFAGILYFWQIPHFLSLAWLCRADYARGGYRMLSTVDPSGRRTGACMLRNSLYLLPLGPAAMAAGIAGPTFACTASVATGVFAAMAAAFALVMAVGLWDRVPHRQQHAAEQPLARQAGHGSWQEIAENSTSDSHAADQSNDRMSMPPFPFLPVPVRLHNSASTVGTDSHMSARQTQVAS
ncbi:Protoheme IX farnesyltransferase, mitochondrial [Sticta canariensis]|nr:Protoheme IX farnesyltransferase, mitochondrial [Sticta canariensis]